MLDHGLTKSLWTDADFDVMGWHDARLYGFTVFPEAFELVMDIDYITKWVHPVAPEKHFRFWVAPATLVFHGAQNIRCEIGMDALCDIEILNVQRVRLRDDPADWRWRLELSTGELSLDGFGYTQYFRRVPVFQCRQELEMSDRGGVSYARTVFDARSR